MLRKCLTLSLLTVALMSALPIVLARAEDGSSSMTAAEHASAASAYEAEAGEAKKKAAAHSLMASRYRNASAPQKGLNVPGAPMANHCQKLADSYKSAASEADSLATLHRAAAAEAK